MNPTLTLAYIDSHPDLKWDWGLISRCINLNTQYDGRKEFTQYGMVRNTSITIDFIHKHIPNPNWDIISRYINIDEIIKHPEIPWDVYYLSWNRSLTLSI